MGDRPFFVFLDEVQTYDGASSGNLAALLEQTAKYGIRAFLFNQTRAYFCAANGKIGRRVSASKHWTQA